MSLSNQFLTLGMMVCSGMGLGIFFDIYRVMTEKLHLKRWLIAFLDILYGLASAVAVFRVLYYSNQGQLRLFIFIGLLLGIYFYYKWFSWMIIWLIVKIVQFFHWCWNVFIVRPALLIYKFLLIVIGFLKALTIFFYKLMLQLTYPLRFLTKGLIKLIKRLFRLS
jgi:spore cortex biosynthesis protein YabQ